MNEPTSEMVAASLLAAVPARGRFAPERPEPPAYPRYRRVAETDPAGPRAARRALASADIRPPRLGDDDRAQAARLRARVARSICEQREALASLIDQARGGARDAAELAAPTPPCSLCRGEGCASETCRAARR